MIKSLAARIVYAPKDVKEAKEISQELGFTTVKVHTHSRSILMSTDPNNQRGTINVGEQARPLLLPQEVKELGKNKEILFYEGIRPILARKNRYYRDPLFKKRLFPPPKSAVPPRRAAKRPASPESPAKPTPAAAPPNEIIEGSVAREEPVAEVALTEAPPHSEPRTREATIDDIDRIESIKIEDFAADLTRVKVPESPMSDEDAARGVANLLQALGAREA